MRRDRMLGILGQAGFRCFKPRGAYYIMTDISAFGFPDDVAFAKYLVKEIGIAAVPGSSFYQRSGRRPHAFALRLLQERIHVSSRGRTIREAARALAYCLASAAHEERSLDSLSSAPYGLAEESSFDSLRSLRTPILIGSSASG